MITNTVADPGFPVGGGGGGGGVDLRCGHFSVKMYAETKELGPTGGGMRPARPLDPPMKHIQFKYKPYFFDNQLFNVAVTGNALGVMVY